MLRAQDPSYGNPESTQADVIMSSIEEEPSTSLHKPQKGRKVRSKDVFKRLMRVNKERLARHLADLVETDTESISSSESHGVESDNESNIRGSNAKDVSTKKRWRSADNETDQDTESELNVQISSSNNEGARISKSAKTKLRKRQKREDAASTHTQNEDCRMSGGLNALDTPLSDKVSSGPILPLHATVESFIKHVPSPSAPASTQPRMPSEVASCPKGTQADGTFKTPGLPASQQSRCQASGPSKKKKLFTPAPLDANQQYGSIANPISLLTPQPTRHKDIMIKTEPRSSSPTPMQPAKQTAEPKKAQTERSTAHVEHQDRMTPFNKRLSHAYSAATTPSTVNHGLQGFASVTPGESFSPKFRMSNSAKARDFKKAMEQDAKMFRKGQVKPVTDTTRDPRIQRTLAGHQLDDDNLDRFDRQNGQGSGEERRARPPHEYISFQGSNKPNVLAPATPRAASQQLHSKGAVRKTPRLRAKSTK